MITPINILSRRSLHPLCGADLMTLSQILAQTGSIPSSHWSELLQISASVLGRLPFTFAERALFAVLRPSPAAIKPPIFILGHWRSGTTHLYNILAKDDQFGYVNPIATGMPWEILGLARMIRPLLERALPKGRFIDNIPVEPDSPQEDEIALANMTSSSFYHAIYFPAQFDSLFDAGLFLQDASQTLCQAWQKRFLYFIAKLSYQQGGRQLLIKNPAHTARIALLRRLYPKAQFIHIHRNPFEVFRSTQNFYVKLFEELSLQAYDSVDIDSVILRTYPRMMRALIQESADLPPEQFIEIAYHDLENDPLGTLARLYTQLGWTGWEENQPLFLAYLSSIQNYKKNTYRTDPASMAVVAEAWQPFIDHWGYAVPD